MSLTRTKNKIRGQKGFSFLEVVISLFVLSVGFLGVIQLATTTLRNSFFQRDAVIASMLVQEGVELVYNVRDTNVARFGEGHAFDGDLSKTSDDIALGQYKINPSGPDFSSPCSTFSECQLVFLANNFYGYGNGLPTKFARKVIVEEPSVSVRRITSVVVWNGDFPETSSVDETNCNKATKCSFARTELQENNN